MERYNCSQVADNEDLSGNGLAGKNIKIAKEIT